MSALRHRACGLQAVFHTTASTLRRGMAAPAIRAILFVCGVAAPLASWAQTTVLIEGFEGVFPGAWYVSDADPLGTPAYWDDVHADFGGEGAHGGYWKGYCAGTGYAGTSESPSYQTYMEARLARTIDLTGYDSASVTFWYKIPSIESCCDRAEVWIDAIDSRRIWYTSQYTTTWTEVTLDLTDFVGMMPALRFAFVSDLSITAEGWYLDDIEVTGIRPPDNDACENAVALFNDIPYTMSTVGATSNDQLPTCQGNFGGGVWFTYAPVVDSTIEVSTCGSDFDTVLQVYSGVLCRILTPLPGGCNDDNGPACTGTQASLRFTGTAQTPYHILVGGYGGAMGNLELVARRIDDVPPVISCPADLVLGTSPGVCSRGNVTYTPTAYDNVGVVSLTCTPPSGSIFPVGVSTVTCVAADAAGNSSSCDFMVTILDEEPPQLACPPDDIVECGTFWTFVPPITWDNCDGPDVPVQIVSTVTNSGCGATFSATRTWQATDSSGNSALCSQSMTVIDTTAPGLLCPPDEVVECGQPWAFSPPAVELPGETFSSGFGAGVPPGTTLHLNASISGGILRLTEALASQIGSFIIEDFNYGLPVRHFTASFRVRLSGVEQGRPGDGLSFNFAPDLPDGAFGEDGEGSGLRVTFDLYDNGSASGDSAPAIAVAYNGTELTACSMDGPRDGDRPPATPIPLDPATGQPMTLTTGPDFADVVIHLDPDGTVDVVYKGVVVLDNVPTGYSPMPGRFGFGARTGGAVSTHYVDDLAIRIHECMPAAPILHVVSTVTNEISGQPPILRIATRTWRASDACGNVSECSQSITVVDTTPPSITCPADLVVATAPGTCASSSLFYEPTVSDNCPGTTVVCSPPSGSVFPVGLTTVHCVATDSGGNTDQCDFSVTVRDLEPPQVTCPPSMYVETCDNGTTVSFSATATDNCGGYLTVFCAPSSGSHFPMGDTTVTCQATDSSGNSAQCQFVVTVAPRVEPPFGLSSGSLGSDPDIAYDSAHDAWFVVWREGSATHSGAGSIYGRLVGADGQYLSARTAVGGLRSSCGPPRVAYDPLRDEFLVVWAAAADPIEGSDEVRVRARRVSSAGVPLGTLPLAVSAPDGKGEAYPDVAPGRVRVGTSPWESYWMIVWEDAESGQRRIQARTVIADAVAVSGLQRAGVPLEVTLNGGTSTPQSYFPRLSDDAPVETVYPVPGGDPTWFTAHQVVFEVQEGTGSDMLSEIYGARLTYNAVRDIVNLTGTPNGSDNEFNPIVQWNPTYDRSVVVFLRGSQLTGQWYHRTGSAFRFEPLGGEFPVRAGDVSAFDAFLPDGGFVGVTHPIAGNEGTRLAGQHVYSMFGATFDTDQPAVSVNRQSGSSFLMVYRTGGFGGSKAVLGRVVCGLYPETNGVPLARAGEDLEVYAGAPFQLDGSGSTDPDGDPLIARWTQLDGPPASALGSTDRLTVPMLAPMLGGGVTETSLTFRLEVDDLRFAALWPASDTVAVRVIPGTDLNPPVADPGPDQTVDEDDTVLLDGSASYDPDGEAIIAWAWTFEGFSVSSNATLPVLPQPALQPGHLGSNVTFKTPRFAAHGGLDMLFRLHVVSASGGVSNEVVLIHVDDSINEPPVADAGPDLTETEHQLFTLKGHQSWDPNGPVLLAYQWDLLSSLDIRNGVQEDVQITGSNLAWATVNASVFQDRDLDFRLTVQDPQGLSATDQVTVHVQAVPMTVTSVTPMFGWPGSLVGITGSDLGSVTSVTFNGYGGTITPTSDSQLQVQVPNGSRVGRPGGAYASDQGGVFNVWEYPEVTSGPLAVSDGKQTWTASQPFAVSHVELADVVLSQGVSSYSLVQGKDSLLQVQIRTREAGASNAGVSRATCYVFTNTTVATPVLEVGNAGTSPIRAVPRTTQVTQMRNALNFFLDGRKLTGDTHRFSISVVHNDLEILCLESLLPSAPFVETVSPRILMVPVVPFDGKQVSSTFDRTTFWTNYFDSLETFERVYPVPQADFVVHPSYFSIPSMLNQDDLIELESFSLSKNFLGNALPGLVQMHGILENWNNGHPGQRAMFVVGGIAPELHDTSHNSTPGFGVPPRDMMARMVKYAATEEIPILGSLVHWLNEVVGQILCAFCLWLCDCPDPIEEMVKGFLGLLDQFGVKIEGDTCFVVMNAGAGSTLAHEIGHNLGFVDPYAANSDPQNLSHSRYDEGKHGETTATLRFIDSPKVELPVYNVVAPGAMLQANASKALMSYVDGKTADTVFHEVADYNHVFQRFRLPAGGATALAWDNQPPGWAGAESDEPRLEMVGFVNMTNGLATVCHSRLLPSDAVCGEALADSALSVVFFGGRGQVLDEVFVSHTLFFHTSPESPIQQIPIAFTLFKVVVEVPPGSNRVELRWRGDVAWSRGISPNPPSVLILAPTASEVLAANVAYEVEWTGSDPDGDVLTYDVYYSSDGGVTFMPLTAMTESNSFLWATDLAPVTLMQGYIKVEASDGFNTAFDVAGPFTVEPKPPLVAIMSPEPGARIPQSTRVRLACRAYAFGHGPVRDDAAFQWISSRDGALGSGAELDVPGLTVGSHELRSIVTWDGMSASGVVAVVVVADTDGDGIADEVETLHPSLDPNDPEDAYLDQDRDGLVRSAELLQHGTDPFDADSDDDGMTDGEEVGLGLDPGADDTDADGVLDGADNCPLTYNPGQEDLDEDGVGDACEESLPGTLVIPAFQRDEAEEMRVEFEPLPGTLAYRYVAQSALTLEGPWTTRDDLVVRRAASGAFEFVVPPAMAEPHEFFRVMHVE